MANRYWLENGMEMNRLRELNDAGRGNHSCGIFTPYGGGSSLTSGDRIISGTSSRNKGTGRRLGNGMIVYDD